MNNTLSTAWGGRYVNDFIDRGRVKRVFVQGDAPYRADAGRPRPMVGPQRPGRNGALLLLRADRLGDRAGQPVALPGRPVLRIPGPAGAGQELGRGDEPDRAAGLADPRRRRRLVGPVLSRNGCRRARRRCSTRSRCWSCSCASPRSTKAGRSRSPSCWSFRSGLVGAIFAVTLRGLQNDVYLQIGLLTTMGLAAKNAILMIEFAERAEKAGQARDRRGAGSGADPACGRS